MGHDVALVTRVVKEVLQREELYLRDNAEPLTDDHVFGSSVLVLRKRTVPLYEKSRLHLEQRTRAITASVLDILRSEDGQ